MFKNYFYLNRAVMELSEKLIGSIIHEIYTQEKDTIYFHLPTEEQEYRHLIISIDHSAPFLILKDEHRKARKNVAEFYGSHLPAKIKSIQIADNDRIVKIICDTFEFLIPIRGTLSNVILFTENSDPEYFKKPKKVDDGLIDDLLNHKYNTEFNFPNFDEDAVDLDQQKKKLTYLTKDILNEMKARTSSKDFHIQKDVLHNVISQIQSDSIQIFFTNDLNRYVFVPSGFVTLSRDSEISEFDNYQDALIKLLSVSNLQSREQKLKNDISKHIEKELSGLSQKLNSLKQRVEEGSKEELYRKYADLLLSNLHQIRKGMDKIVLNDFSSNESFNIELSEKLSPKQNVDYYYDKARGEKINYQKSIELFEVANERYEKLLQLKKEFEKSEDLTNLQSIKDELGIKDKKVIEKENPQAKFRHFIIDNIYHVFVGRDSKSNDQLSTKFAKQNDYWFHARGYAGSHTVLRVDNPKEGVPKNILKNAASIAAFYSKAKTAGTAPVSYTFAKYVRKRKGMEPGKVMLQKEQVLLVKPEIPKNAEHVED